MGAHTFSPAIRDLLADPCLTAVIAPSRAEPFGAPCARGRHLTAVRYDYQANIAAFLTGLAPWATTAGQST